MSVMDFWNFISDVFTPAGAAGIIALFVILLALGAYKLVREFLPW
jgi:hypothetical protein